MAVSKVLIFGSTGLLGSRLAPYLRSRRHDVVAVGRRDADYILPDFDSNNLKSLFTIHKPDCVINLVAATNVDLCERDVPFAVGSNMLVPASLSKAIESFTFGHCHFIHISTDQVYDGTGEHKEEIVCPLNVYGLTKYSGELMIKIPDVTILRTNFFGRSFNLSRESFSDWVVRSLRNEEPVTFFEDVRFSALHIDTLCELIDQIIIRRVTGTYNLGCSNGISKADFAIQLAQHLGLSLKEVIIGKSTDLKLPARRPLDMTMDVGRFESVTGFPCPDIFEQINKTAAEYEFA
jgi:dTDP-4-dehydrorhamnose reductase